MTRVRIDKDGWCRCGECGHKLFRILGPNEIDIEIKCHSCKAVCITKEKEK